MSFDFFDVLPPELRADLERHRQAEAVRLEHAATCKAEYCATCRRVRCGAEACSALAVVDGRCAEHDRLRREAERAAHLDELVTAQLPEAFREASLGAAWLSALVGPAALAQARAIVGTAPRGGLFSTKGWATIYASRTGAGKTSLAAAMVRERGRRDVLWTTARTLATAGAYAKLGEEPALLASARRAGLLVIDELGTEADRFGSQVAETIMDRHDLGRTVWVTTPLPGEALSARYGSGLVRRLSENGEIVRLSRAAP
jgi:DNA replication protein DnaC